MDMGKRIKERRKELGLTVDDVAKALGKNRATVYRYESSEIENLPVSILEPLAKILKTSPVDLLGWSNSEPKKEPETKKEEVSLDDRLKYLKSLKFPTPEAAMKFILEQPVLMNHGGYNLDELSDDEIMNLAEELVLVMEIGIEKLKRKKK